MTICLIGAGNLATQLGMALAAKGSTFSQVYSRTDSSAGVLAKVLQCESVTRAEEIKPDADLYICALKDDALPLILPLINFGKGLVVHTAGSLPMQILSDYTTDYGVFYPFQTLSKQRKTDFSEVPFFIEAAKPESLEILRDLASKLSNKVIQTNSDQRKHLHLSAVFACNFVNYLYSIAEDLVKEQGLDFQYLLPIIEETAIKVQTLSPAQAQTGPAVRFDRTVMDKHLALLQDHPDWKSLYDALSEGIHKRAQKN